MPLKYPSVKVKKLYEIAISNFACEKDLNTERNSMLLNLFFKYALEKAIVVTVVVG